MSRGTEGRPGSARPDGRLRLLAVAACLLALPALAFFALDALFPFPVKRLAPAPSTMVLDNRGAPMRFFLAPDQAWRFPVALDEVAPVFLDAVLASEDRHFFHHPGINPISLLQAAVADLRAGAVVRGGSTITMQVARLAEPKPRTLVSKVVECFRALQLESRFTKREILGFYVNMAPYGGNLVGVGAASWFYFGKAPSQLALAEAALLTAIPRSPGRFHPVRHPQAALKARASVLAAMAEARAASPAQAEEARTHELPGRLKPPPLVGPHFAQMVLAREGRVPRIRTTLDSRVQEFCRQAMRSRLVELRSQGVENAAVVVLDVKTREVLALAGSADFLDEARHGRVNAALANRSPGSALKPFLYAAAFQDGLLAPESLLLDIPLAQGGYDPHNYDGTYRGRVEAREALIHSLNTPAVRLLAEEGPERFLALLRQGGLRGLDRPASHYGLSLVLGGGEVNLLDLTNLYATLAQGGLHGPPVFTPGAGGERTRLFSPEASALVTDILSRLERPDLPGGVERARGVPAVAWKTGTSFGHRDAWAVGFSSRFAIGVWTGNVQGQAVKGISGARQAAPLLFDLFRALEPDGAGLPKTAGLNLAEVEVCALSRQLPGPDCAQRVRMTVIPGVTALGPCPVHRRVLVDAATGLRVAGACLDGREVRQEVVTLYPAELTAWWRSSGVPVPEVPASSPGCPVALDGQGPRITSPGPAAAYHMRPDAPEVFQRVGLSAQAGPDSGELHWFQDGVLVASRDPGETFFLRLAPGRHRLTVVDGQGRSDSVRYVVEP